MAAETIQQDALKQSTGKQAHTEGRGLSKTRIGFVVSNKMDKTIVVSIVTQKKHAAYGKYVQRSKKYYAHDERNECQVGDRVQIVECRPRSSLKRWQLRAIVGKAK